MKPLVCDCLTIEQQKRGYHIDLVSDQSAVLMFGIKDVEYYTPMVDFDTIRKDADTHWKILLSHGGKTYTAKPVVAIRQNDAG